MHDLWEVNNEYVQVIKRTHADEQERQRGGLPLTQLSDLTPASPREKK